MEKFSTLSYNKEIDRYVIGTRQLHCGDCFQVKIENDVWKDVRIEKGTKKGWYLVGISKSIQEICDEQISVKIDM